MSRPILEIGLRLPDGKVVTGRGRNMTATAERLYNQALTPASHYHAKLVEHPGTGHLSRGEHRYQGTFHLEFTRGAGQSAGATEVLVAEVRESK